MLLLLDLQINVLRLSPGHVPSRSNAIWVGASLLSLLLSLSLSPHRSQWKNIFMENTVNASRASESQHRRRRRRHCRRCRLDYLAVSVYSSKVCLCVCHDRHMKRFELSWNSFRKPFVVAPHTNCIKFVIVVDSIQLTVFAVYFLCNAPPCATPLPLYKWHLSLFLSYIKC